uniref:Tumor necrosis factor receptor superfamily member 5-like n=1 Tax=Gouania willdenowi TaxID=441366 RepID=A0A8C5HRL8_GOUWI
MLALYILLLFLNNYVVLSSCEDPDCVECAENEYQETYTYATRCKRQPYCDPNRNFRTSIHSSKNTRAVCMCELGFHCSSDECLTCVPHTACEPGFGVDVVLLSGNHSQDTVCEKCLHGTFSNENSWDGVCHKWTTCEEGYDVVEKGSDVLDNKCGEFLFLTDQHQHVIDTNTVSGFVP